MSEQNKTSKSTLETIRVLESVHKWMTKPTQSMPNRKSMADIVELEIGRLRLELFDWDSLKDIPNKTGARRG